MPAWLRRSGSIRDRLILFRRRVSSKVREDETIVLSHKLYEFLVTSAVVEFGNCPSGEGSRG